MRILTMALALLLVSSPALAGSLELGLGDVSIDGEGAYDETLNSDARLFSFRYLDEGRRRDRAFWGVALELAEVDDISGEVLSVDGLWRVTTLWRGPVRLYGTASAGFFSADYEPRELVLPVEVSLEAKSQGHRPKEVSASPIRVELADQESGFRFGLAGGFLFRLPLGAAPGLAVRPHGIGIEYLLQRAQGGGFLADDERGVRLYYRRLL